jgi:hypothetical protein
MLTERRGCSRINVISDCREVVLVDLPHLNTSGLLVNLSETGMALQFACPVQKVGPFAVDFSLGETRMTGRCDIVWATPTTFGLRFLDLSQEERSQIRSWIDAVPPYINEADGDALADENPVSTSSAQMASVCAAALSLASPPDASAAVPANPEPQAPAGLNTPSVEQNDFERSSGARRHARPSPPAWATRMLARQENERRQRLRAWRAHEFPQPIDDASQPTPTGISNDSVEALTVQLQDTAVRQRRSATMLRLAGRIGVLTISVMLVAVLALLTWSHLGQQFISRLAPAAPEQTRTETDRLDGDTSTVLEVLEGKPVLRNNATTASPAITGGDPVRRELPSYRADRLPSAMEQEVRAELTISPAGVVEDVRILAGDPALAAQVETALRRWRYTPYMVNSVAVRVKLPVTLRLRTVRAAGAPTANATESSR